MADLSIIIPARNEKYLQKTVEDIYEHREGDTEILVGLDGYVKEPFDELFREGPYFLSDTIKVIRSNESIGQRAMTNKLAKLSTAKYILKVDAENWQVLPQQPTSMYVFDTDLVMQHWREGATQKLIEETMCPSGAAFMVTRENYWKWNLCDESLGSWGGQVTELGIKAYLNGGRCVTNKNCFFGHLFREKKEDFPYERGEHPGQFALEELRKRYKNKSIAGLIEKFNYPANWTQGLVDSLPE